MRLLTLRVACALMLTAAWALDLVSPQLVVVAILLTAPIALSGIALRPRFTVWLVIAALAADASAGWYNAYHDGYRWQAVAVGDRFLAAFAIVLVGVLTVNVQRNALRSAALGEMEARSQTVRDVIYSLSHDLRTPIMAARMTMQQALDGAYGELPAAYRTILETSIVSNEDLHRLAETLLLVARYESGDESATREEVDLAAITQAVAIELSGLARAKRIAITMTVPSFPVNVLGDASEIKRAVVNLVANAVTWTPEDGHVQLELERLAASVVLRVTDDGYGVQADGAQLFQRFSAPGRKRAGTGLGLYIVRRIAEAHGGEVRYRPAPERGSIFELELPLYNRLNTL